MRCCPFGAASPVASKLALGLLLWFGPVVLAIADEPPSSAELYVTGVAHIDGLNQTRWRSSLEVCNFGPVRDDVELELLLRGQGNPDPGRLSFQLATGVCARYEDVVGSLFDLEEAAGAIRIRAGGEGVLALAHTANHSPDGSFGSGTPARSAADAVGVGERAVLIHLTESADDESGFRTNIDLLNLAGAEATVEISLHSSTDTHIGTLVAIQQPFEYSQLTRVFRQVTSQEVTDGYAVVRTTTPEGSLLAGASLVDNRTGDVVAVPAMRLEIATPVEGEEITLVNQEGYNLAATLFLVEGSETGVVLAHSGVPGQSQLGLHPIARDLTDLGLTVLTFDIRGYGATGGTPAYGKVDLDVRAAIRRLRMMGLPRVAAMGVGLGAIGCAKCGQEPGMVGLALISCPISVSPPLLQITSADMAPLTYPKLIIAAEDDTAGGRPFATYAQTIYGYSRQPKTLVIYPGPYHSMQLFTSPHGDELHDLLLEFLSELDPGSSGV